jgi:hypothetical protein
MAKGRKFFGWFQSRDWNTCPVEVAPYGAEGLDTIVASLREIIDDFDNMIAETDQVIKTLSTPRPYLTRDGDEKTDLTLLKFGVCL